MRYFCNVVPGTGKLATGINDAGGRIFQEIFFTNGVNYTGSKFATNVNDTGGK